MRCLVNVGALKLNIDTRQAERLLHIVADNLVRLANDLEHDRNRPDLRRTTP